MSLQVFISAVYVATEVTTCKKRNVLLIVTSLECLTFNVQNDVCAELEPRRHFILRLVRERDQVLWGSFGENVRNVIVYVAL